MKQYLPCLIPLVLCLFASCTLVQVDTRERPPGIATKGLIDGHMVFGFSAEDSIIRADLFDRSGAIFELGIWKLFRIEVGLAGFALGVGPIDMGLGIGFYKPRIPFAGYDHDHTIIDVYDNPDGSRTTVIDTTKTRRR